MEREDLIDLMNLAIPRAETERRILALFDAMREERDALREERKCDKCGGQLVESPYVGGDHDPYLECKGCGKHFGCSACRDK